MNLITDRSERRFRRFGILTIASVFFLIFVGGLVRSTGSGLGCPDWPKCFDKWVPPTDVNELPADYKEKFKVAGHEIADFDVYKTWTEYINRLIGVFTGFFIFLTVFFAIPYLKTDKTVFWLSFVAFILVGFQGWIGAKVISSNLVHWMITIHMLIALIIVGLLIYTITRSQQFVIPQLQADSTIKPIILVVLLLILIQTLVGTQVRASTDQIAAILGEQNRLKWIGEMGTIFRVHRSLSVVTMVFVVWMTLKIRKSFARNSLIYRAVLAILLLVGTQIFSGKILDSFGFPRQMQAIHLFIGSLIAGLALFIALMVFTKVQTVAIESGERKD
ncbi:MAG: COX15/CtaA family protein [Bacteroidia bacterium]|jgi:cytochrome c oxidase assembly protein subunit 15